MQSYNYSGTGRSLAGKVALITGAARGQGEAEARLFVDEGAQVIVADVLDDFGRAVVDDLGEAARFVHLDVTNEQEWSAAIDHTLDSFGLLNILVNNAGIHRLRSLSEETLEGFMNVMNVNLVGTFLGMRAAVPAMRTSGGGSIINIASVGGMVGHPSQSAYAASKWGVRGLTRVGAIELGPHNIRVNAVAPGPIQTEMMPESDNWLRIPLNRPGQSSEVAQLVRFLASDESSFVNGADYPIDGGSLAGPASQS